MMKQISGKAHFLDPINHSEALTTFAGVRTGWLVEAIMFNSADCEYDECEEADGSFVMHDIEFADGSSCYFEVFAGGTLSHFHCNAFLEFREGILVVSPRSVFEAQQKERVAIRPGTHKKRKINFDNISFD